ncbi:MAG TPA: lamin tail domain-containing protein, partial [Opitutaceae bacterium]|nr:lamin tail domain-containing protein [Opitutaceae bacterium]
FSISRTGAAQNVWALTTPTLGAVNGAPVTLAAPASVKINEWAGNIVYRLDHDMIELYNTGVQPVAIAGVRLTDDVTPGRGFVFPTLSFMAPAGFLPLYKGDYVFGLNGDRATVTLLGENNEQIDQITMVAQPNDRSQGRNPDGSANIVTLSVPSPGIANNTPLPPAYQNLLNNLRITEVMYDPASTVGNASQFEFVELQNIGTTVMDLSGVRFTNGIDYTFPVGSALAPGAFVVVANDRSSFLSRYPNAAGALTTSGGFNGSLDNDGETIALTLPSPWKVHILRFRYESSWFSAASGGGNSIVPVSPATAPQQNWQAKSGWTTSVAVNGSPGAADLVSPGSVPARLINLSILTSIAASGDNFTMGYVVGGAGTSGAKPLVIRAAGPSLGALGVPGTLADPTMELFAGSTKTGENNNWGGTSETSTAMASVGAFPYSGATSLDAAVVASITTRDNSVKVSANGTGTGTVIAEIYDATPEASFSAATPRLLNVSVLKQLGSSLTVGFVVRGSGTRTVLVRAVGPTLNTAFGIPGAVSDPQFTLFAGSTAIGSNNNWGGTAALSAAFTSVGAFNLPATSLDAALLTPLTAGDYSVVVTGVAAANGQVLVEVYEVP